MNSLYTRMVSGLVFPLHERLKHHDTVAVRRQLEQTQWWSPDRLAQLQGALRCGTQCGSCVPELKRMVQATLAEPQAA